MLNDEQDKAAMRQQSIALVVMLVLFLGWMTYFGPKPTPTPVTPKTEAGVQTSKAKSSDLSTLGAPAEAVQKAAAWPFLPPVPAEISDKSDDVAIRDNDLELVFTRIGARLKRATVLLGDNGAGDVQLVPPAEKDAPDTQTVYPLGLRFSDPLLGDELDARRFEAAPDPDGRGVTFSLELPGAAIIKKSFHLGQVRHVVDIEVSYENREAAPRTLGLDLTPAYILNWGPSVINDHATAGPVPKLIWRQENLTLDIETRKLPAAGSVPPDKRVPAVSWIGYKTLYFLAALKPAGDNAAADGWMTGSPNNFRFGLYQPKFEVATGQTHSSHFQLYAGPLHMGDLKRAWDTLPSALRFYGPGGWFGDTVSDLMDWFAKVLLMNLNWWHRFVPNYGVAIILLTVLVRAVVFPLTIRSIRSMKKMQALQPEMTALREKFKDNPQELQQAMMLLYKERKINPLAGCLPVFLQMPVFFALYRMLWYAFELRGAKFLWIADLSQPDRMFHFTALRNLPLIGDMLEYFNLLPFLVCGAMLLSFRLMPQTGPAQNQQQKFMMNFMPIMFTVMGYKFASGLNLYVLTSTLLGIVQNRIVRATDIGGPAAVPASPAAAPDAAKKVDPKDLAPFVRKKKPQHFYDRAQQRKREMAKADRKRPKKK